MVSNKFKFPRCSFQTSYPFILQLFHSLNQLPGELLYIETLDLLPGLSVEDQLGRLARNLLEHTTLKLGLEVPVDEVLHLGELRGDIIRCQDNCFSPCSAVIRSRTRRPPGRWCRPRIGRRPRLLPRPQPSSPGGGGRPPTVTSL